jgi:hypothetical protein
MARTEDQKLVTMNRTKTMEKKAIKDQQDDWKTTFRCAPLLAAITLGELAQRRKRR